jgi:dUTP pyrophosphatase
MLFNGTQVSEHVKMSEFSKVTQAGVDLSVMKIEVVLDGGTVLKDKTIINANNYETLNPDDDDIYSLPPGVYSVTFNEGVTIPRNAQGKVTHRSSIYRMGNIIESPWWDAGFFCDNMNTTLIVTLPMKVEQNARLAQIVMHEMPEPKELYNGQWQGKSTAHGK